MAQVIRSGPRSSNPVPLRCERVKVLDTEADVEYVFILVGQVRKLIKTGEISLHLTAVGRRL